MDLSTDNPDPIQLVAAIEIGGRGHRVALATAAGDLLDVSHAIVHGTSAVTTIDTLCSMLDQTLHRHQLTNADLKGIGVSYSGPVDSERGITFHTQRIPGFDQFPVGGLLEERYGVRATLENSARSAAMGEYTLGAGRGSRDMVYLHLGTGVGGALVLQGKLQRGASGMAGEIGHMVVTSNGHDGPRCSCGKPGHLEAYASEPAMIARMRLQLATAEPHVQAAWMAGDGITMRRIFDSVERDAAAEEVVREMVQVIGIALANLVTALSPDAVVIGGYVVEAGPALTAAIRAKIRQYAFDQSARRLTVSATQLGSNAGLVGAVVLATRT